MAISVHNVAVEFSKDTHVTILFTKCMSRGEAKSVEDEKFVINVMLLY